jgi:hypothetical protein
MTLLPDPPADFEEKPQDWFFTFGVGHKLVSFAKDAPWNVEQDPNQRGYSLAKRFVRINGTRDSARQEMFRRWGTQWSMQYDTATWSAKDLETKFNLTELKGLA